MACDCRTTRASGIGSSRVQRNGSRPRSCRRTPGNFSCGSQAAHRLSSPRCRTGAAGDQALFAVVMEAYLHGVSTRKVDDLVQALVVATGISKSEVSRICADLDDQVAAFRGRSLAATSYPYVFLDATYCCKGGKIVTIPIRPARRPRDRPQRRRTRRRAGVPAARTAAYLVLAAVS